MKRNIPIVLTFDDGYVSYASITISSIMSNSSSKNSYEIIVVTEGLTDANRSLLESQISKKENFSIKFISLGEIKEKSLFYLHSYMTISTYFRFFLPRILPEYDKVLYLDCDLVLTVDVALLFEFEMYNNLCLCVEDSFIMPIIKKIFETGECDSSCPDFSLSYIEEKLGLDKNCKYFNAGVMLMNLDLMRKVNFTEKLLNKLKEVGTPVFQDQDILNSCINDLLLTNGYGYLPVDKRFNTYGKDLYLMDFLKIKISKILRKIKSNFIKMNPVFIMHYIGPNKPWTNKRPGYQLYYSYVCCRYTPIIVRDKLLQEIPCLKNNIKKRMLYKHIMRHII